MRSRRLRGAGRSHNGSITVEQMMGTVRRFAIPLALGVIIGYIWSGSAVATPVASARSEPLASHSTASASLAPGAAATPSAPSSGSSTAPAAAFATPEDAIAQYVAGVAAGDFDQILSASAIDQMAAGYHFDRAAARFNAFLFGTMSAPATNSFYQAINRGFERTAIARYVLLLTYSLLSSEQIDITPIAPVDLERAQQFIAEVDPSRLHGLSLVEARFPNAKLATDPKLLSSFQAIADVWGADELTQRAALISLDGNDYVIGFTLLRYGPTWLVMNQTAPLLSLPSTGVAVPATQAEFEALTSDR
jgi:hypothetical protein